MPTPEYQWIFDRCREHVSHLNFKEENYDDSDSFESYKRTFDIDVKYDKKSKRVENYNIRVFKTHHASTPIATINYQSRASEFKPGCLYGEDELSFYEPDWKQFTDKQLKQAHAYLENIVKMRFDPERDKYHLLVFEDHFHLAIKTKHLHDDLYHNLCISAYDVKLDKIKC